MAVLGCLSSCCGQALQSAPSHDPIEELTAFIDDNCLGCICEASSGCNLTVGCSAGGGYYCGPFYLSWAYWADAGKFVLRGHDPEQKGAFEACANDPYCAAITVRSYMKKFQKDCNNDGHIECEDFARIHKLGGYSCYDPSVTNSDYHHIYSECTRSVNQLNGK